MTRAATARAFSLIEVVLALAVMSFALVAVVGLFSVGLKTNKESSDQIHATDVASLLIAARRAAPTTAFTTPIALPPLNVGVTNSVPLNLDGTTNSSSATPFRLKYTVTIPPATPKLANLYLLIWWPATAAAPATNSPGGYYQVSTQISLP